MKPIRLIQLFRQIAEQTTCPNCGARIRPDAISIDASTDNSALLTIHCADCKKDLHAHVMHNVLPEEGEIIPDDRERNISEAEIDAVHQFLQSFDGDISSLFSEQK